MKQEHKSKPHVATSGGFMGTRPITVRASRPDLVSVSKARMNTISPELSAASPSRAASPHPVGSDLMRKPLTMQEFRERFYAEVASVSAPATSSSVKTNAVGARPEGVFNLITITREQITSLDFSPILSRLSVDVLPEGHRLALMMGMFKCHIVGYSHSTLTRQDTREYFHQLDKVWPYWAYFFVMDARPGIFMPELCLEPWTGPDVLNSIVSIATHRAYGGRYLRMPRKDNGIIIKILDRALRHLKVIASMSDLSELQVFYHCYRVIEAFRIDYYNPQKMEFQNLARSLAWPMAA